ncbi:MAG: GHMP kinase [Acidobacteria bacterium]|nr:MAG: GHMP kinase [Acidobacteriota bacterium]
MTPPRSNSRAISRSSTEGACPSKPTIASRPIRRRNSRSDILRHYNPRVRIDCSAPTRIDLAGGTIDIWPLYLFHQPAVTLNAAISLRAHCAIEARDDGRVVLVSEDTGERVDVESPAALGVTTLPLVARLVRFFDARGLTLTTRSDSPVGAGIAGSSAMNIALISALASFTGRSLSPDEVLEIAKNVEAQVIDVPTGVQDYRPALYGGISAVELDVTGIRRVPIAVPAAALASRIVLAYTRASRNSGINNWDMMKRHIDGESRVVEAFDNIASIARRMRAALEAERWEEVGRELAAEWDNRKRLAPGVTTPAIDTLLDRARGAGAVAGKVCGAGGGGCLFCLVPPEQHADVSQALADAGARVLPFQIEDQGVHLRTSR